MSFLESIKRKKGNLKVAETVVTHIDGKIFKESKNHSEFVGNCHGFVVDTKPDKIPAEVTEFIYLGSQDCCDIEVIDNYNIKFVLSVGIQAPIRYNHIQYKFVDCLDLPETNLHDCLRECIPFLKLAEDQCCKILVHCNAGISRSSSIVLGYLILIKGNTYEEALDIVKSVREFVKPNIGFEKQLKCL